MKCCEVPKNSIIFNDFGKIDYIDSYRIKKSTNDNIEKISSQIFRLPPWANLLMKIRDVTVQPLGLKISKPKDIFFTKIAQIENELIMGENDRHLNFRVSIIFSYLFNNSCALQ